MTAETVFAMFVTLFVVVDPIGLAPVFVALTAGVERQRRLAIATRAAIVAGGVLALFAIAGEAILGIVGISMAAFRISGGLLLFLIAVEMLFERRGKRREKSAEAEQHDDPSVFPLATPLIAGPGAMATMILLASEHGGGIGMLTLLGVMVTVLLMVWLLFRAAPTIERLLGHTGISVITRLLGMFLAALSVQFVVDGLTNLGVLGG